LVAFKRGEAPLSFLPPLLGKERRTQGVRLINNLNNSRIHNKKLAVR